MIKICEECGKEFETNRKSSRWCNGIHIRKCLICGKEFQVSHQQIQDNKRCCSRKCSNLLSQKLNEFNLSNKIRYCKECGKPFTPTNNNQKYCTSDHFRPCPVCGEPVKVANVGDLKSGICRTCSDKCANALISSKLSGRRSEIRLQTCAVCGKTFELQWPYNQKTCSSECRGIYRKRSGISSHVYENAKSTNLKRYGKENPGQVSEFIEKRQDSMERIYGVRHAMQSKEILNRRHQTYLNKYGVDHSSQSEFVKEKQRQTMLSRYGYDNYFRSRTNLENSMTDPSKLDNWLSFKDDPVAFIDSNFDTAPNIYQLCESLGVTDTRIYDILIDNNAQSKIKHYSSQMESELVDYLHSVDPSMRIIRNDRKLIPPYELDIYLPDYNLAIECNPAITHNSSISDQFGGDPKPRNYHKMKTDMCEKAGIQLFHIFGWEWRIKKSILCSMIRNLLGYSHKIYGRNTYVDVPSYEETVKFLNENHRQGYAPYSYTICLKLKDSHEIVSLMTFGKLRVSQGRKSDDENSIELVRFCNKLNASVIGGASKLFKWFIDNNSETYSKIVSFSDRSHTCGNLYPTLGFKQISISDPGYCWVNRSNETMYSRVQCQKRNLRKLFNDDSIDIENKTEREIMIEHGFVQVYDSGVIRWEYML